MAIAPYIFSLKSEAKKRPISGAAFVYLEHFYYF
jgi:hypothetical protein